MSEPPPAATQRVNELTAMARWALARMGAHSVNDAANLVPACRRCNCSKGAKVGWWTVRGLLGAHRWYWPVRRALLALAIAACLGALACLASSLVHAAASGEPWPDIPLSALRRLLSAL